MMPALHTGDADTLATIDEMVAANLAVLGDRLVGVYVYGSLVTGDFDPVVSDIDLVAVLTDALDVGDYDPLRAAYAGVTAAHPRWHNRVELAYIPLAELRTYRADYEQPMFSHGDGFEVCTVGVDWLLNRETLRRCGAALYGPEPARLIDPLPPAAVTELVRELAVMWRDWVAGDVAPLGYLGYRAYAVLTLCRCAYTSAHGGAVTSKRAAAAWAAVRHPAWAPLLARALEIYGAGGGPGPDDVLPVRDVRRFSTAVLADAVR
ncbi:aminoglycoside adenylyltransferase domain-containing protein [Kineosporia sp. R_H_3]|uniref:aminoglycoside adenylyltransferase domain-containing protein n=1 Tax=Kineosporia sp. R_H_3 TaxID=1961848 RepID=UPI000B4AC5FF|nr:aminoglycoside adenylyltransferase domain-containing protein [Kineosporia sp. R_H_3]